jgi:ATP-dependent RNA helicase DDX24/MAK5
MAKKRKESRAVSRASDDEDDEDGWMTRDDGWNAVDVNSSALMLGATEDGFMSLEVLDPSAASDFAANARAFASASGADGDDDANAAKSLEKPAKSKSSTSIDATKTRKVKGSDDDAGDASATFRDLDERALDGLSGKEKRIMKRKLRWKAKIEAKKLAKKTGGVATNGAKETKVGEKPSATPTTSKKAKKTRKPNETKTTTNETTASTSRGLKPDEELIDDEAMDVEEDWEKITHKSVERESSRPTTSRGFDYSDHKTSGMGAVAEGVDLDRGCDVSAWLEFDLHPLLTRAIQDCGFTTPTPIQRECLHPATKGRCDIIGAAQTGSGKTLAFALPILHRLLSEGIGVPKEYRAERDGDEDEDADSVPDALRALIVAPTRELALQVCAMMRAVAVYTKIDVCPVVGGMSKEKQERLLNRRPAVIVATPGRLWDTMQSGHAHVTELGALSFFVLDEADRMVERGHFAELTSIIQNIPQPPRVKRPGGAAKLTSEERAAAVDAFVDAEADEEEKRKAVALRPKQMLDRQTFVFSATLTVPDSVRRKLKKGKAPTVARATGGRPQSGSLESLMEAVPFYGRVKMVDLTSKERKGGAVAETIAESALECTEEDRDSLLYYLLSAHPGMTIVFVNAISCLRRVTALLKILKVPVEGLHAGMQQRARLKALDRFKAAAVATSNGARSAHSVLVATDVAARGLDVKGVELVIHYQIPLSADTYIHRSGRTGRADKRGAAVSLVTPKERSRYYSLLKSLNRDGPLDAFPVAEETLAEASRRLAVTRKIDRLAHAKQKAKADKEWRQTNAEELGIILSESESDDDLQEYHEEQSAKSLAAADERKLRAELDRMLAKPLGAHRHSLIGSAKFPTRGGGDALIRAKRARALEEDAVSAADMLGRRRGGGGGKKKKDGATLPAAIAGAVAGGATGKRRKRS